MKFRLARPLGVGLGLAVFIVHSAILFVVVPEFSSHLMRFYNQNTATDGYDLVASNLAAGFGYRFAPDTANTLMREPGYVIFLAGLFSVFGRSFAAIKLANIILALLTAGVISSLARKLSASRAAALGAPLIFLFHPGILIAESRAGLEVLFAFLLALFVWTLYRAVENGSARNYLLSGVVLGVAVSVKSTPMLFPVFWLVYLVVTERERTSSMLLRTCRNIAIMVMAMFAVLSPWILRNYKLTGRFIPSASVLGVSAHAGQYIGSHLTRQNQLAMVDRGAAQERKRLARELGYEFKGDDYQYYPYFYATADEVHFSDYLLHRVIEGYKRSPVLFLKCAGLNLLNFWVAGKTWRSTLLNAAFQLPFLALAITGVILCFRSGRAKLSAPLVLIILYSVLVTVPILAQARYSVPITPFVALLASVPLAVVAERIPSLVMRRRQLYLPRPDAQKNQLRPDIEV